MSSSDEKITLFLNAISENLEMRRKEIEQEIAAVRRAEQEKAEQEAGQRSEAYIKAETAKVLAQANRTRSLLETGLRNELAAARSEITDAVFTAVAEKLKAFVKSADYELFLQKSAVKIAAVYGGKPVTIFVKTADLKYKDSLLQAAGSNSKVEADDSILIGGCKAVSTASSIRLDDTLDARLAEQKQGFYERSGLSVQAF